MPERVCGADRLWNLSQVSTFQMSKPVNFSKSDVCCRINCLIARGSTPSDDDEVTKFNLGGLSGEANLVAEK